VVPDYGTDAVAFHAITLVLTAMRRIGMADTMTKAGKWDIDALRPLHLPSALSAGVIGFGRIGRKTADHLKALGFGRVLAHDAHAPVDAAGIESASLQELLSNCDVVTLHAPAREDGAPLLGELEMTLMRPGSILVNTARGSLIDTEALAAALATGRPALAALDVFESEPPGLEGFSGVLDRVIMTPHMAWYTEESERDLRTKAAMEARRLLDGEPLLNQVTNEAEAE
jgi:D-3-phosphoglycerate dehydrogenase